MIASSSTAKYWSIYGPYLVAYLVAAVSVKCCDMPGNEIR